MTLAHVSPALASCLALLLGANPAMSQPTTNPVATPKTTIVVEKVKPDLDAWWNSAVFYQIFVRSFADSTSGPLANDGVGDLKGIIERLDYLNDGSPGAGESLGINALWLMPIMQSPSYHGYDISDYKKVQDAYGTNEDYKQLLAECKKRGIRVILDLVPNHSSWENPWFKEAVDPKSEKHDWYVWSEKDPGWKGPWNQEVWH
ncbi:MAG: alpha-amylase family glycosyl hydrolase, partial [Planctomycetota bacterium]